MISHIIGIFFFHPFMTSENVLWTARGSFLFFSDIGGHFTPQASMCSDLNLEHTGEDHGVSSGRGGLSVPDAASPCSVTKTLLAKLTIRKPSILSITSNLSSPGATQAHVGDNFGGSLTDIHDIKRKSRLLQHEHTLLKGSIYMYFIHIILIRKQTPTLLAMMRLIK